VNDDVDRLLHLAQFNFETYMAEKVGALDQTGGPRARPLLAARAEHAFAAVAAQAGLVRVLKLNRIPDFSVLHDDDAGVNKLWKLRASKDAVQFRQWFHANVREQPEEAEALFVDTLAKPSLGDNMVVKALR